MILTVFLSLIHFLREIVWTVHIILVFLEHYLLPAVRLKRPNLLNFHPFMLHDDARSHIPAPVVNLLRRWNWKILEYLPYSPDMSPCDFDLLAKMILHLRGGDRYRTRQAIIAAVEQYVRRLLQDSVDGIRRLSDVWRRVLHVGGYYFWSLKQWDCTKNLFLVVIVRFTVWS